jgi:hypothetical protein
MDGWFGVHSLELASPTISRGNRDLLDDQRSSSAGRGYVNPTFKLCFLLHLHLP